ncbi:short chain dehydrogenase [Botrytis cinerea]
MFRTQLLRHTARAARASTKAASSRTLPALSSRPIHNTASLREKLDDPPHEGSFARTDSSVHVEYPEEHELPSSKPVQGRGGLHFKRTLASFSLEGRVGVVTGGARGLGLVMSQAMVTAHYADVSSQESVDAAIAEIISQHGKIDNLVTSAGFTENFEAINYPIDRVRKLWGVNVDGTYLFAIAVAKHLIERKAPGSMVFIGSMSGAIVNVPQPQAPYNAAKAAVRHLASSLAVEWAHAGIRVNCISPGYMLTALTKKILDENPELKKQWTSLIPQGKMGQPEDLMGAVTFLSSDASNYVTGADLRVDGGYTLT